MTDRDSTDLFINATFPAIPSLRHEWNISREGFDAFLAWLDQDRESAGRKYEDIRRRLVKIFTCRGCICPDELADEVINRVLSKVRELTESYSGDPARYFGGVARNVLHEYVRRRAVRALPPPPEPPESRSQELDCLDACLDEIPTRNRELILRYYEGRKGDRIRNRNEMAHEMGTEQNALRIRVHRIRSAVRRCVGDCLASGANR